MSRDGAPRPNLPVEAAPWPSRQRWNTRFIPGETGAPPVPRVSPASLPAPSWARPARERGGAQTARERQRVHRRRHPCPREGHRLSPCEARDARPLFLRASTRPPFPSAIASRVRRARQLIGCMREVGSVLVRWAEAKRPAAWRTAGRRTPCRASTGGIGRGNGRNGSAQRHPSRVGHPAHWEHHRLCGDGYQGRRGRPLPDEQNAAPGRFGAG